jgi:hypothetical protein
MNWQHLNKYRKQYTNWWLYSFPPLHGALRFFLYATLLLSALFQSNKSPIRGFWYYEATDPKLFRTYGLVKLLHIPYLEPVYIRIVIILVICAWFCAAIGLFTRISTVVTAIGVFFLHGIFLGSNAFNHAWFLTMYAFIALCFARTNDRWSVDYYLKKYFRKKIRHNQHRPKKITLADTGFARQLFLVFAVGFYFAAGLSKLHNAGLAWTNGHLIQYFAEMYNEPPLGSILANSLFLSQLSAVISLLFELGAIAALFSRQARLILVLGWIGMHIGIRFSLGPRYIQNIICLTLLIDWRRAAIAVKQWLVTAKKKLLSSKLQPPRAKKPTQKPLHRSKAKIIGTIPGIVGGTCLIVLMASVALGQIFWWPLTTVYMYSSNYSNLGDIRADYPRKDYYNPAKLQKIAREFRSPSAIEATQYLVFRVCLRLTGRGNKPLYLFDATESYSTGVPKWKQFILTVARPVIIEDLASKPLQKIAFDPNHPEYPAQKFLLDYAPILRNHVAPNIWQKYDRIELVYPVIDAEQYAIADKEPIPEQIWQHYKESGDEIIPIPEARFVPIASVSLKNVS